MDVGEEMGKKLSLARRRAGLTQKDLAGALNLQSKVSVSDFEKGKTLISAEHLVKLPSILGCRITDLLPDTVVTDYDRTRAADPRLQAIIENWQDLPEIVKAGWAFTVEQYKEAKKGK